MNHPAELSWLFFIISIVVVLGVVMKGALAIVAFRSVLRRRLMTWRAVTAALGLWLVLTGCGIGLATLLLPMPAPSVPVSWPVLVLGIGLFVPLVEVSVGDPGARMESTSLGRLSDICRERGLIFASKNLIRRYETVDLALPEKAKPTILGGNRRLR